jgi:hypothetical protein
MVSIYYLIIPHDILHQIRLYDGKKTDEILRRQSSLRQISTSSLLSRRKKTAFGTSDLGNQLLIPLQLLQPAATTYT